MKSIKDIIEKFDKEFKKMVTIFPDAFVKDMKKIGVSPTLDLSVFERIGDLGIGKNMFKRFLLSSYLELLEEWGRRVVGENETWSGMKAITAPRIMAVGRNRLRQEQRQQVNKLKEEIRSFMEKI